MRTSGEPSVEALQTEVARLRAEVSELRERESALRTEAEVEQRRAGQRAGALHAEWEYVREQAVESRRLANAAEEEAGRLRAETEWLRAELGAAQRWIARSPYFRLRHLIGRFLRRR